MMSLFGPYLVRVLVSVGRWVVQWVFLKAEVVFKEKYLYKNICWKALDQAGMDLIERLDTAGFHNYLKQFGNTICGRHPIGVFLNMVAELKGGASNGHRMDLKFLKYAQSSQVISEKLIFTIL